MPSGGDYTTLAAWEAGEQADIVTADVYAVASIEGDWTGVNDGTFIVSGWTTDATRYIEIRTVGTARHDGKRYGSKATAHKIVSTQFGVRIGEEYVRVDGLQSTVTASANYNYPFWVETIASGGSDVRFISCVATASFSGTAQGAGFVCTDADATVSVVNCIAYGFTGGGSISYGFWCSNGVMTFYNCTAVGNNVDFFRSIGTVTCYNCISQDSVSDGFAGTIGGDYNCSDRASDAPGANSQTGEVTFVSETGGSEDFHLAGGDTVARGKGTSNPGSGLYLDDIDGMPRRGLWDIGADQRRRAVASLQLGAITTG